MATGLVIVTLLLALLEKVPTPWPGQSWATSSGGGAYATLRGWQHLPDQLMSMSTPVWMGLDRTTSTGSYFWALVPLAGILYLSGCCMLLDYPTSSPSGQVAFALDPGVGHRGLTFDATLAREHFRMGRLRSVIGYNQVQRHHGTPPAMGLTREVTTHASGGYQWSWNLGG